MLKPCLAVFHSLADSAGELGNPPSMLEYRFIFIQQFGDQKQQP